MPRPRLPLNALRAFEAAARHQNLTRAASELCVSQAALSHQIKALEQQLRTSLFHRLPRGVALTDEGAALVPVLGEAFDRIAATLERFADGRYREVLSVGVVGTFATGWLLPRVDAFHAAHPEIELRLSTHNNRVDLAGEGLDLAIRFGDGDWQGQIAHALMEAPFAPVCAPSMARGLRTPANLAQLPLLRSYRLDEWPQWFRAAGVAEVAALGAMFDSSLTLASAAAAGAGVALLPLPMFRQDLDAGRLVCPFPIQIDAGRYWLTRLRSRPEGDADARLRDWLVAEQQRSG
ncbi:LysR family transcriptional regulator AmpR [Xanthomonas arboricola pv. juglandis]|uniref:HTH-type transcriptional activator AmpR n=1 Tax=Xanthomonas arboricola pv. corylina TaxID=487821 RepID=A0A2S7CG52_9XANT|nr:LysR family transcriptional regulator AmpR [Xanthomonas arboricola]MDN0204027.1 LysR family transcriptional regulator AmpR [Xanthomonas arboricola pv. corylina]MDN0206038.1 LysR family transcriptional regulator AmpR [Xanthomonas arboricola pv. corylina]MDN0210176.1 LysR family transcriptional regulator AmpR [Xanthomonas arboricola pv. corylina]MDN0216587.1 LysR family transcriptional regulator AmpR [Xanthomonas arboricola pv. corylina]MDN0222279.1 LysR family transcriptional regulator AmpR 